MIDLKFLGLMCVGVTNIRVNFYCKKQVQKC